MQLGDLCVGEKLIIEVGQANKVNRTANQFKNQLNFISKSFDQFFPVIKKVFCLLL
jgi:hypothetical protein